ncbi:MAG: MFS transporter [Holosporales bacterium]|nr:MFS transporter [Holosporales bacterium]
MIRRRTLPWAMWGWIVLFYCYQYVTRTTVPNLLTEELMERFSLDAAGVGTLISYYYLSYTFMQIPVGYLLDRYGARRLSAGATLLCAVGMALFVESSYYFLAALGRILTGIGAAFAFVATLKVIADWFPAQRIALLAGLTATVGAAGPVVIGQALGGLIGSFHWQTVFCIYAILGGILSYGIWHNVRDRQYRTRELPLDLKISFKKILLNKQCWLLALYTMLLYTPMSAFADMWGTIFLKKLYGIESAQALSLNNLLYIGMAVGAPLMAKVSGMLKCRKIPLYIGALGILIAFGSVTLFPLSMMTMIVVLFLGGVFINGKVIAFTAALESVPKNLSGSISGFVNMACMMSGVVLQPLLGKILVRHWDGQMECGHPLYSIEEYRRSFFVILGCLILAVFIVPKLKETFPKELDNIKS